MPVVNWVHPELRARLKQYAKVRDCIEGSDAVKHKKTLYLPQPNAADKSAANLARYNAYLTRAVFYNVTGRTRRGFVGQIFARPPEVQTPAILAPLVADMTGLGVNLTQHMKGMVGEVVGLGHGGLLSEYPTLTEPASVAAVQSGAVKPIIIDYKAEQIINWQYIVVNGNRFYTLIVLKEPRREYAADGFTFTEKFQFKVLRIDETGHYIQEVYNDNNSARVSYAAPTFANGSRFDYIPFEFIGSDDNDASPDSPPLYDLAELNLAHYRNSADFEELAYLVGQPTPVYSGLTQQWVDSNFKDGVIYLGSGAAVPLPAGGRADLLQAAPNQLYAELMSAKETQMVAIGAKLAERSTIAKTATEASQDNAAESSQLETIADNAAVAYAQALESAAKFVTMDPAKILIKLNTAFQIVQMDAASRAQLVKEWQQGAISFTEMRAKLRGAGIATQNDDVAKSQILEEERQRAATDPNPTALNNPGDE